MPVGDSLLVPSKKLWRWYHDSLSGFLSASAVKERHQHDFVVKTKNGKSKNIRVPILEALSRSRYLLYKYPQNWTETQRERAVALFKLYPEIEKSYQLCCKFRAWYSKENVGRSVDEMRAELRLWYSEVEKENVLEMENFSSLVERHEGLILNYFVNGDTNAIAEAMNCKIQRMITLNKGTKNKEFFLHKMKNIFSSTSKWD